MEKGTAPGWENDKTKKERSWGRYTSARRGSGGMGAVPQMILIMMKQDSTATELSGLWFLGVQLDSLMEVSGAGGYQDSSRIGKKSDQCYLCCAVLAVYAACIYIYVCLRYVGIFLKNFPLRKTTRYRTWGG
jgi:hypothetical protein